MKAEPLFQWVQSAILVRAPTSITVNTQYSTWDEVCQKRVGL
jgi:hypothetical protein